MTTMTAHPKAVVGRRIEFTFYRDLDLPDGPTYPGIITGTETGYRGGLRACLRLDGQRSTLSIPVGYEGITYLDTVVPVPDLPMGAFIPEADDRNALWEIDGVLCTTIGEDGDDIVIITADQDAALATARAHLQGTRIDIQSVDFTQLAAHWAVFEWEPEDSEMPWQVRWPADGHEKAVHIYYLPIA